MVGVSYPLLMYPAIHPLSWFLNHPTSDGARILIPPPSMSCRCWSTPWIRLPYKRPCQPRRHRHPASSHINVSIAATGAEWDCPPPPHPLSFVHPRSRSTLVPFPFSGFSVILTDIPVGWAFWREIDRHLLHTLRVSDNNSENENTKRC